jgi:hypothetical protein
MEAKLFQQAAGDRMMSSVNIAGQSMTCKTKSAAGVYMPAHSFMEHRMDTNISFHDGYVFTIRVQSPDGKIVLEGECDRLEIKAEYTPEIYVPHGEHRSKDDVTCKVEAVDIRNVIFGDSAEALFLLRMLPLSAQSQARQIEINAHYP